MYLGVARAFVVFLLFATVIRGHAEVSEPPLSVNETDAEVLRQQADLHGQRQYAWRVIGTLTGKSRDQIEAFESWHGENEVFDSGKSGVEFARGIRGYRTGFSGSASLAQSADSPIFTYTLYNNAAFNHIRDNHLYSRQELQRLQAEGRPDIVVPGDRDIPQFPAEAIVLKTAWWPISQRGISALPVWDPDANPPGRAGIGYLNWRRIVAVDPAAAFNGNGVPLEFAGRSFRDVQRISLSSFYHVQLDKDFADRLMLDTTARKQAAVVLGRALQAGDYLVLVGANLATRETRDWVWATLWWHDRPESGPYAYDRPQAIRSVWRNYLMQVAFDATTPEAIDGSPHICFNPWLEGRFPDGGHGSGTESNCMACHARASYPPVSFLPITRGSPHLASDEAYLPGKLRTSFLWSIALHASP